MKTKRIILGVLIVLNLNSCQTTTNDDDIILNEYKTFDTSSKNLYKYQQKMTDTISYDNNISVFFKYNKDGKLQKVQSFLFNHKTAHFFDFNDEGKLKKYYYLLDSITSCIEINSESQKKITERGSPFIDNIENETKDTVKKYTLLFSQFPRKKLTVHISYNGIKYDTLSLIKSRWMPLLKEADIQTNSKADIFLKIEASQPLIKLDGLDDTKIVYDTIKFRK